MPVRCHGDKESRYVGCVLDKYEHNGYDDSDFYAVCWDEEKGCVVEEEYDTTRCGGYGTASIDATPEVIRKAYRWYFKNARYNFDKKGGLNERRAKTVNKGSVVKVIRGSKVKKGTVGEVFWVGTTRNRYTYRDEDRVGIKVGEEKFFLPLGYVEVDGWEKFLVTGKKRKEFIQRMAMNELPAWAKGVFGVSDYKMRLGIKETLRRVV